MKWYEEHEAHWVNRMPLGIGDLPLPEAILGLEDATAEWNLGEHPEQLFAPISSYWEIQKPDSLFLFGRRGTGKTTTLRMLDHQVRKKEITAYFGSLVIHPVELADELTTLIKGSTLANLGSRELIRFLNRCWMWVITVGAMTAILHRQLENEDEPDSVLLDYVGDEVSPSHTPEQSTAVITSQLLAVVTPPIAACTHGHQLAAALLKVKQDLFGGKFRACNQRMTEIILQETRPVLILIDTEEVYPVHDEVATAVRSALIEAVLDIYKRPENHIQAKAAFPSEILPHMRPINREKTDGKTVFLLWGYKDLVTFVAKRFKRILSDPDPGYSDLNDYKTAKAYLYRFIPHKVYTRNRLLFDTLSYIIRHTQKKPRQVLMLFNTVLALAKRSDVDLRDIRQNQDLIRDGIHARLDMLLNGSLDIYEDIYPGATRLVRGSLTKSRSYFLKSELDQLLHAVNPIRAESSLSKEDVKRLLLETGVIGIAQEIQKPEAEGPELLEAMFEYQIKDVLDLGGQSLCVIHPMCYEELHVAVDSGVFCYPVPYEDEEANAMREIGVRGKPIRPSQDGSDGG